MSDRKFCSSLFNPNTRTTNTHDLAVEIPTHDL
jgi:hypothetical protein